MDRRHFIKNSGFTLAGLIFSDPLIHAFNAGADKDELAYPDSINALINGKMSSLSGGDDQWNVENLNVFLDKNKTGIDIKIKCPGANLETVTLIWDIPQNEQTTILNDHLERTYGDISWHKPTPEERLPWYFMEVNGFGSFGFGVATGAKTFCFWQIKEGQLMLHLDTRNGTKGVELGSRELEAARIVTVVGKEGENTFRTAQRFMSVMCPKARMPKKPVYGINDWYYTYGNNSEKLIIEHTKLMAPLAAGLSNKPFSVIDAGWFKTSPHHPEDRSWGESLTETNDKFGNMASLADKIKELDMRPGIWTRPLCGSSTDKKESLLSRTSGNVPNMPVLDPSIPENLERIKTYFETYKKWGYELIKFDYTTFDIFGKWGFQMKKDNRISDGDWTMNDKSRTNAEIILDMYLAIREASGDTIIIGCNTFSHLSAGVFELYRIGDDTSGNEWERTLKMGVNTLAFRGIQHGTFYAADADCVGLTTKIPWEKNKQWLELVASSGTPLFISAQPDAIGEEQKKAISESFRLASKEIPVGEPMDWMDNNLPRKWKLNGAIVEFNW